MVYGYIRISSASQNTRRQEDEMAQFKIPQKRIYVDVQSGKDFKRSSYQKLLRHLKKGDLLLVTSIDRLGRNYLEILDEWRKITREIKADIRVLDMPLLDTTEKNDLTRMLMNDVFLQLLSYVADSERHNIRRRQKEGICSAKARGVVFGRPKKPVPKDFAQICRLWRMKRITAKEAIARSGLPRSTFYYKAKLLLIQEKMVSVKKKPLFQKRMRRFLRCRKAAFKKLEMNTKGTRRVTRKLTIKKAPNLVSVSSCHTRK